MAAFSLKTFRLFFTKNRPQKLKLFNCLALLQFPIVQLIYLRLVKIDSPTNVKIHHFYTYGSFHYVHIIWEYIFGLY